MDSAEHAHVPDWLELHDPQTGRVVYANTATGECSWARPQSTIKPRDPAGEWWELQDEETGIPYYYNSRTGATEWDPPEHATVVPFHTLLGSSVGKRLSMVVASRASIAFSDDQVDPLVRKASRASLRSVEGRVSRKNSLAAHHRKNSAAGGSGSLTLSPQVAATAVGARSPSIAQAQARLESGRRGGSAAADAERQKKRLSNQRHSQSETALETLKEAMDGGLRIAEEEDGTEQRSGDSDSDTDSVAMRYAVSQQGRRVTEVSFEATQEPTRMSEQIPRKGSRGRPRELSEVSGKSAFEPSRSMATLGSHRNRSMPSIRPDRALFGMRAFAATHFAAQKRGFLRRKVPVEELISYSAEPLARPLMNLPRELNRDAARSFAIIQCFMRDLEGAMTDADLFSEVLWLANQGIRHQLLRDEVFCQLAKQVTGHTSHDSAERGWVLMGVLFYAFRPSQLLFPHLEVFVESAQLESANLKRFLLLQLGRVKRTGSRTTLMTKEELHLALLVPRRALVFGGSLKEIMQNPELVNAEGRLPRVLELLTAQITRLGGERTEGLFRVPGDADAVAMARLMIEAGQQTDFPNLRDPNVPASLLKEWLRDLADPLIPEGLYDQCIARSGDRKASLEILSALPEESYCVVDFLLRFLKHLLDPEIEKLTKMDSSNLALVFGPSFLRNPVSDLKDVFANSSAEQTFLLTLLESFQG